MTDLASWKRVVVTLRVAAWRLFTPPPRRRAWAAELAGAAEVARTSLSLPVRRCADGLAELAARAARRRSRRWPRDGARDAGLQLARLIEQDLEEQEPTMPTRKKPVKPQRKPAARAAKTVASRTAKTAKTRAKAKAEPVTQKPARGHATPRLWVLSAYVAASWLAEAGVSMWNDPSADAARLLYRRAEGEQAEPNDEVLRCHPRPGGFSTWASAATRLAELAIFLPHAAAASERKGSTFMVSPYVIRVATDPKHEFFDPRGLLAPSPEMVASIKAVGVLDRIKIAALVEGGKEQIYAADGRQRRNAAHQVNRERLREWWMSARAQGRVSAPPELLLLVPVERLGGGVKEAQRAGGVLNSGALRRDDSLRDLSHRVPQLRAAGYQRDEIAVMLGISAGTVSNLLALEKLAPSLAQLLWAGELSPACAYTLATQEHAEQDSLWLLIKPLPPPRRAKYLKEVIALRARIAELEGSLAFYKNDVGGKFAEAQARVEKELETARAALAQLLTGDAQPRRPRAPKAVQELRGKVEHLGGEGARIAAAVLDWTLGVGGDDLEVVLQNLRQSSAVTVEWRSVVCPECCVDPGQMCQDDEGEWNEEHGHEMQEPHAARIEKAREIQASKAPHELAYEYGPESPLSRPASTVDAGPRRANRSRKGDRGIWSGFAQEVWEEADVWDERVAQEVAAAGLKPDDLKRKKETLEHAGQTYGYLLSGGRMTIAQIQAALRQEPLLGEVA